MNRSTRIDTLIMRGLSASEALAQVDAEDRRRNYELVKDCVVKTREGILVTIPED